MLLLTAIIAVPQSSLRAQPAPDDPTDAPVLAPGGDIDDVGDEERGAASPEPAGSPTADAPAVAPWPEEALAFLPTEALAQFPGPVVRFLRPSDWKALAERCPGAGVAERLACVQGPDGSALIGSLFQRAVVSSLLARMDAELPLRIPVEALDAVAENCDAKAQAWAECAFSTGPVGDTCDPSEDALALCLVDDDVISGAYMDVQNDKKRAFGPAAFVELRGLLAPLTLADVETVRAACPGDGEGFVACLRAHPRVAPILSVFTAATTSIVDGAATALASAGNPFPDEARRALAARVETLLLTMPVGALSGISNDCEASDPRLANPTSLEDIEGLLGCIDREGVRNAVANPAYIDKGRLRAWLESAREKVSDVLREKEAATQVRLGTILLLVFAGLAGLGVVAILMLPLVVRRRHPGKDALLWRSALIAAATFAATMAILALSLLAIRTVQGQLATDSTSPKMRVADAAFAVLMKDDALDGFVSVSELRLDFIKAPLRALQKSDPLAPGGDDALAFAALVGEHWASLLDEPEFRRLAKNLGSLAERASELSSLMQLFRRVDWLMGLMPIILAILAVLLYLLPLREWLVAIVTRPARAAASAVETEPSTGAMLRGELLGIPFFLLLLLFLLPLAGMGLALAIEPLMAMFIGTVLGNVLVIIADETSSLVMYGSLVGSMALMVVTLVVYILTIGAVTAAAQRILRARFQKGVPFAKHRPFLVRGALSALWLVVFPVLFAIGFGALVEAVSGAEGEAIAPWKLWALPLLGLVLFGLTFWLLRAGRALGALRRFRPAVD